MKAMGICNRNRILFPMYLLQMDPKHQRYANNKNKKVKKRLRRAWAMPCESDSECLKLDRHSAADSSQPTITDSSVPHWDRRLLELMKPPLLGDGVILVEEETLALHAARRLWFDIDRYLQLLRLLFG